jgi:hypothetical protein
LVSIAFLIVAAEQGVEAFDGVFGAHGDGGHQPPEVGPGPLGKTIALRAKKAAETGVYAVDGNHAVFLPIRLLEQHPYRPEAPLFCCAIRDHDENRSV